MQSSISYIGMSLDREALSFVRAAPQLKNPFLTSNKTITAETSRRCTGQSASTSERGECSSPGCTRCIEESMRHQATKRALDKAILLANMLLEELQIQDIKTS